MSEQMNVRWGWLRFMYLYTFVGAGGLGLGIILVPGLVVSIAHLPTEDPIILGIVGSVYLSFGLLSLLGLRDPLKFLPILLLQLCYKAVWSVAVILPLMLSGSLPSYAIPIVLIFMTWILGDLIAIPFSYALGAPKGVQTGPGFPGVLGQRR
ncbi:MAG: hypothetical protein ACM3JD_01000 [Rudaea sp.]